ncbi:hypothetical protein B0A55_00616 [Friedmanniomyces simplex]|uniref:Pcc1-domain-containing protein n=1 Tax=Friedmanniomyces simplex TaxID=329884 RepID=A0A4U0Y4B5_9PEZI|nr:hypothetical protein B0A55_00616 [Friedmanniomyces simplex]
MAAAVVDPDFPCSLLLHIPFPTHRLAKAALRTLCVDEELSPLVKRSFSLAAPAQLVHSPLTSTEQLTASLPDSSLAENDERQIVLRVDYKATTNRMLRVAVNGFFESLGVVIQVMEELDVDVLHEKGLEGLEGVQGVEQGMTGITLTGA